MSDTSVGVNCGICGGPIYMHTCDEERHTGHYSVLWSECHRCGAQHHTSGCPECALGAPRPTKEG